MGPSCTDCSPPYPLLDHPDRVYFAVSRPVSFLKSPKHFHLPSRYRRGTVTGSSSITGVCLWNRKLQK